MQRSVRYTLAFLIFSCASIGYPSEPSDTTDAAYQRPKIGLVLGGGGARGAAHIGVIRMLEELNVPVDYIAGTSMGSLVGGLYASGLSADELEATISALDWSELFTDQTQRKDRPFRRKLDDNLGLWGPKLGIGEGSSLLPAGAIHGQKISFLLESLTGHVRVDHFDDLPIPFRAVAADIVTGKEVVLDRGNLALAMRSSMSVPGAFDPVPVGDFFLVDGAIVNNVPIDVVRNLGADVVIAVDVGSPLAERDELDTLVSVIGQLSSIMVKDNTDAQIATLTPQDVLVVPALGDAVSTTDFDEHEAAIRMGYEAAQQAREQLATLAVDAQAYTAIRRQVEQRRTPQESVEFVRLDNRSRFDDAIIWHRLNVEVGQPLDVERLEQDIQQIYALGFLGLARYEVVKENGQTGVVVHVEQDSRGTQFIEWGLVAAGDNDSADVNLRLGYLKTDLDRMGSELRVLAQVGDDPALFAEIYKPVDRALRLVLLPKVFAERREFNQRDADGDLLNTFELDQAGASMEIGYEFGRHAAVFAGIQRYVGDIDVVVGDLSIPQTNFDGGEYFVRAIYDRVDDRYLPSVGTLANLQYRASTSGLGADEEFEQVQASAFHSLNFGRHSVIGGVRYETTLDNDAPLYAQFRAGGFTRLSGVEQDELQGQHFGMALLGYRYEVGEGGLFPAYVGTTLEYGNVADSRKDIFDDALLNGSLYFGYRSPLGPIYVGYGRSEGGRGRYFLRIGDVFSRKVFGR